MRKINKWTRFVLLKEDEKKKKKMKENKTNLSVRDLYTKGNNNSVQHLYAYTLDPGSTAPWV